MSYWTELDLKFVLLMKMAAILGLEPNSDSFILVFVLSCFLLHSATGKNLQES